MRREFDYDSISRRVEKRMYAWDPNAPGGAAWSTAASLTRRFVWYNWLLLAELDGSNVALKKHTWGLDLSGTLEGAGGIGGLLAVAQAESGGGYAQGGVDAGEYVLFYDANGNVGQLVDPAHDPNDPPGAIAARYEYDAYGNVIAGGGAYAGANAWRFSTKWWDDETGMGYWGNRYCLPTTGRWLSRDPIEESGGTNLYVFINNQPSIGIDAHGYQQVTVRTKDCGSWDCADGTSTNIHDEIQGGVQKVCDWLKSRLPKLDDPAFRCEIQACIDRNPVTKGLTVDQLSETYHRLEASSCKATRAFACKSNWNRYCNSRNKPIMVTVSNWRGSYEGRDIIVCTDNIADPRHDLNNLNNMMHELLRWWKGDGTDALGNTEIHKWDSARSQLDWCWTKNNW